MNMSKMKAYCVSCPHEKGRSPNFFVGKLETVIGSNPWIPRCICFRKEKVRNSIGNHLCSDITVSSVNVCHQEEIPRVQQSTSFRARHSINREKKAVKTEIHKLVVNCAPLDCLKTNRKIKMGERKSQT